MAIFGDNDVWLTEMRMLEKKSLFEYNEKYRER